MGTELQLDLKTNPKEYLIATKNAQWFYENFGTANPDNTLKRFPAGPLGVADTFVYQRVLFDDITSIIDDFKNDINVNNKPDNSFVIGLKIHYGMTTDSNGNDVTILIYAPVCLDQVIDSNGSATSEFTVTPSLSNAADIYIYHESEGFYPIDLSTAQGYISAYKNKIRIEIVTYPILAATQTIDSGLQQAPTRPEGDPIRIFKPFLKSYGDPCAILFSYQEIEQFYNDCLPENNPDEHTQIKDGTIYFTSTTFQEYCDCEGKPLLKHRIDILPVAPMNLAAYYDQQQIKLIEKLDNKLEVSRYSQDHYVTSSFAGKAANMSNLCPPNCSTVRIVNKQLV